MKYTRVTASDTPRFHALCLDEHVRRYLLDGVALPEAWAAAEIERSDALFAEQDVGLWLMQNGDAVVGFCGFRVFEAMGHAPQLLYALLEPHTGRGLASEACAWMLERTRALGWSRVHAAVDAPNAASIRVLEKNGFVRAGNVPGQFGDTFLFVTPALSVPRRSVSLDITTTWDAASLDRSERVVVDLAIGDEETIVEIDAPLYDDPAPLGEPGTTRELWNHEVVELMLLGEDDHYLEIELAPRGHYLLLELVGRRNVVNQGMHIHYDARIDGDRWTGRARIPNAWLPPACDRVNAYAIHGVGAQRRYLAWRPRRDAKPDDRPDFHLLSTFGAL